MDNLTTGYFLTPVEEDEPKKSETHLVSRGLPFCKAKVSKDAESVTVSFGIRYDYLTCKNCKAKYRKEVAEEAATKAKPEG
jgi:hypothetical protein